MGEESKTRRLIRQKTFNIRLSRKPTFSTKSIMKIDTLGALSPVEVTREIISPVTKSKIPKKNLSMKNIILANQLTMFNNISPETKIVHDGTPENKIKIGQLTPKMIKE